MSGPRGWSAAVAAPGVLLSLLLVVALVLAAAGRSPVWPDERLNLSEAIAARADADIRRLRGARLDVAYDVRPGLLSDGAMRVTPVESAVLTRRAHYLARLFVDGAALDAATWSRLRCLAEADVAAVLDRYRPAGAATQCHETSRP